MIGLGVRGVRCKGGTAPFLAPMLVGDRYAGQDYESYQRPNSSKIDFNTKHGLMPQQGHSPPLGTFGGGARAISN